MGSTHIVLVGERDPGVLAHRAIEASLGLLAAAAPALRWTWLSTADVARDPVAHDLVAHDPVAHGPVAAQREPLASANGIRCVPASPYRSFAGALAAIRFARLSGVPFLGTCGGFQHAVVELVRGCLGVAGAAHAEIDPEASELVVTPLACALVEVRAAVVPVPGTRFAAIVGGRELEEGFHCRFGLDPAWEGRLASAGVRVSAHDSAGEARAVELEGHPFFLATLFQPERAALAGACHPIVRAFATAAARHAEGPGSGM